MAWDARNLIYTQLSTLFFFFFGAMSFHTFFVAALCASLVTSEAGILRVSSPVLA